uniref:Uncharacterized protein n=1 Tax=Ananas comosus var. bracteatus TaxID=296719 RepID=A0A6V7PLF0_ANACO|nr:unnamed protein product [Ananas comosus var. bracteatus]
MTQVMPAMPREGKQPQVDPAGCAAAEGVPCCQGLALRWSLIELDRDTLHTRLGSAHECHSGVRLCAFALVSLMPVGLALHRPVSVEVAGQSQRGRDGCIHSPKDGATGFGCCAFRGSGSRQGPGSGAEGVQGSDGAAALLLPAPAKAADEEKDDKSGERWDQAEAEAEAEATCLASALRALAASAHYPPS